MRALPPGTIKSITINNIKLMIKIKRLQPQTEDYNHAQACISYT